MKGLSLPPFYFAARPNEPKINHDAPAASEEDVQLSRVTTWMKLFAFIAMGIATQARAEDRAVANGLEVHETELIVNAATPTHFLTKESCADAQAGWKIVPDSVKTEVVTARMMDPGGDPDWKVEKAEAHTRVDSDNGRICLWGYCQGPLQFQCEVQVRASWKETR